MPILFLRITSDCDASTKEGDVPEVGEDDTGSSVNAEDLHTGKWGDNTDPEAQHVSNRSDSDRDGSFLVAVSHPHRNRIVG